LADKLSGNLNFQFNLLDWPRQRRVTKRNIQHRRAAGNPLALILQRERRADHADRFAEDLVLALDSGMATDFTGIFQQWVSRRLLRRHPGARWWVVAPVTVPCAEVRD